jgi:hypothetical protein
MRLRLVPMQYGYLVADLLLDSIASQQLTANLSHGRDYGAQLTS